MIVCISCGHENDDGDEFCGSCGNFLEWEGERAEGPEAVVSTAAAPPVSPREVAADEQGDATREAERLAAAEEKARTEARAEAVVAARARADAQAKAQVERAGKVEVAARRKTEEAARAKARARSEARVAAQVRVEEEAKAKRAAQAEADRSEAATGRAAAQAEADARAATERTAQAEVEASAAVEAKAKADQEAERHAREVAEAKAREQAADLQRAEAKAMAAEQEAARAAEAARRAAALVAKPPPPYPPAPIAGPIRPGRRHRAPSPQPTNENAAGPDARKPGKGGPDLVPVRPTPPPRTVQPGDLICGQCGVGNTPARRFCRSCGTSLVEAVVAPEPSWWRRLWSRRRVPIKAGERPGRQGRAGGQGAAATARTARNRVFGVLGTGKRALALLGVAGITIGMIGPWRSSITGGVSGAFESVRRTISPQYEPVRPTGAEATASLADHGPLLAVDGISNSYWAEGGEGDGQGETLVLRFDRPVDLDRIGITSGTSGEPEDFVAQPRPERLHLVFSDGSTSDLDLEDSSNFQIFDIKARQATSVEVHIESVYGALGGSDLAITEVELFTRS